PEWLRDTMEEVLRAINHGVDVQGVCLYPCIDIPDWNSGEWAKIGIFDIEDSKTCERIPCQPYIEELQRWERALNQPERLEVGRVQRPAGQISKIRDYAKRWAAETPGRRPMGVRAA